MPSPLICAVPGCRSSDKLKTVSFFHIPVKEMERWTAFLLSLGHSGVISDATLVCSVHFTPEQFKNFRQKSLGFAKRLVLVDGAVPSLPPVRRLPLRASGVIFRRSSRPKPVSKPEPVHSVEEEQQEMISHDVAENCLLTCLKWLEQQPDASPKHLDALRELHMLAKIKKGASSSVPVSSGSECAVGNPTRSSHPQQGLDGGGSGTRRMALKLHGAGGHDNMEAVDGAKRPFVTFPHPDQIRTVTVSEEHIKTEQDWEPAHVELKCEPSDISISEHKSSYVFTGR
ncbi:hypothetical protein GJAV_G00068530 [Gymnothorax javanicus]|nr:hypothetical protein GJAV_G00068530 [Gymnothorax javanicus]